VSVLAPTVALYLVRGEGVLNNLSKRELDQLSREDKEATFHRKAEQTARICYRRMRDAGQGKGVSNFRDVINQLTEGH